MLKQKKRMHLQLLLMMVFVFMGSIVVNAEITQDQFNQRIASCKAEYKNYSTWTSTYYYNGTKIGIQCWGWAMMIGEKVFGSCPAYWPQSRDISTLKKGDIIRWEGNGAGHSTFVTNVSGNTITFADCNGNGGWGGKCGILWDQTIGKYDVMWPGSRDYRYSYHWVSPGVSSGGMSVGYDRALPDGDYVIASAANPSYYLDIQGGDFPAKNLTNVALWQATDDVGAHDVWTVTYNSSDKFYTIKQKGANISLDVASGSSSSGANVQAATANNSAAQKWAISYNGIQGYRIQAKCSGLSLDITGNKVQNSTNIQQHANNDSSAQAWVFIPYKPVQPIENGRYVLVSGMKDNVVLDVVGDTVATDSPTNVQIWDDSVVNQYNSFDVTKLDNGYYKLVNAASGMALDVYGGGCTYRNNVAISKANTSKPQQWAITKSGAGYILRVRSSGYCLNVQGYDNYKNGTNVFQWPVNGPQNNQIWKFVPAEHTLKYDANGGALPSGMQSTVTKYYKDNLAITNEEPERAGYEFLGWATNNNATVSEYAAGSSFTKDVNTTLYAVWTQKNVVRFHSNCDLEDPEEILTFGKAAIGVLPSLARDGYTLLGWYDREEGGNAASAETVCTGDLDLYAHWEANTYQITFDGNGGAVEGSSSGEVTYNQPYGTLPIAARANYVFQGWYTGATDGEEVTSDQTVLILSNQTLYAHWKGETKAILLNPNGGTLEGEAEIEVEYGSAVGTLPTPKKDYHIFVGWFTTPGGGSIVDADTVCGSDMTLYAHWEEDPDWHEHTPIKEEDKAATCTEDGYLGATRCSDCGEVLEEREVIPATGHAWEEWRTIIEATAESEGIEVRVCANDKEHIETRPIAKSVKEETTDDADPQPSAPVAPSTTPVSQLPSAALVEKAQAPAVSVAATEAAILATVSETDPAEATYYQLQLQAKKAQKTAIPLKWNRVPGATQYIVYGAPCGKNPYQKLTVSSGGSYNATGLKKGTYYKFLVVAANGTQTLATSKVIHVATAGGKKGNLKSLKLNKKSLTLKVKKTAKLKATTKGSAKKHRKVMFESSDPKIATVTKAGKVKAVGKGTCIIYAYTQNGLCAKCKIKVK